MSISNLLDCSIEYLTIISIDIITLRYMSLETLTKFLITN